MYKLILMYLEIYMNILRKFTIISTFKKFIKNITYNVKSCVYLVTNNVLLTCMKLQQVKSHQMQHPLNNANIYLYMKNPPRATPSLNIQNILFSLYSRSKQTCLKYNIQFYKKAKKKLIYIFDNTLLHWTNK